MFCLNFSVAPSNKFYFTYSILNVTTTFEPECFVKKFSHWRSGTCILFPFYWAWYFFVLYLCLPISALILWRIFLNTFQQVSTVWHFHFNSICFYIEHATAHTGLLIGDRQRLSLIMELPIYCYTALVLETGCKLVTWLQPR